MQKPLTNQKISRKRVVDVEAGDIRRYAEAVYAADPVHLDLQAAKAAGYSGLLAPPTFCGALGSHADILMEMELNPRQVLHSEQTLNELEPVCSGDTLTITCTLLDHYEKTSGSTSTGFVIVEDAAVNQRGKKVFFARRVFAIRGGFPRR
jgi:acyl dehydratase